MAIESRWLVPVTILVALACSDRQSASPEPPVPGVLNVTFVTPAVAEGALTIKISGPAPLAEIVAPAGSGYLVFSSVTGNTARVAVFGDIRPGVLLQLHVPDVNKVGGYSAVVLEAADPTNELRASLGQYSLAVIR